MALLKTGSLPKQLESSLLGLRGPGAMAGPVLPVHDWPRDASGEIITPSSSLENRKNLLPSKLPTPLSWVPQPSPGSWISFWLTIS